MGSFGRNAVAVALAGFRAPTLTERFAALRFGTFSVAPNPNMRSERSWSFEVGGKQAYSSSLRTGLDNGRAVFNNEFTDLVGAALAISNKSADSVYQYHRARITGIEVGITGLLQGAHCGF